MRQMLRKQKSIKALGCKNKIVETKLLKIAYWQTQLRFTAPHYVTIVTY